MTGAKPPPLYPRRHRKGPAIIVAFAIIIILLPVVLFLVWRIGISRDIHRLEAKARAVGEPITLKELAATRKPVPDDENAAAALMDIWQEEDPAFWTAFRAGAKKLPDRLKHEFDPDLPILGKNATKNSDLLPWDDAQLKAARAFVATNKVRAKRIRVALSRPKAQFPLNFAYGFGMYVPHLAAIRNEARRLHLATLLAISENQSDPALKNLEETIGLSKTLQDEPLLIGQLVRMTCVEIAFSGAEQLLQLSRLSKAQLNEISNTFASLDLRTAFHQGLLWERANGISIFDKPLSELGSGSESNTEDSGSTNPLLRRMSANSSPVNALGFFSLDERLILRTYDQLMDLSRKGDWNQLLKVPEVIRTAEVAATTFPPKIVSKLVMPSPKAAVKCISVEARRRCALLAIEVIRFRQSHEGRLPETLDLIVAKNSNLPATDPFDGKQLRYHIVPPGFVIYSVGPDRIDQQGDTARQRNKPTAYDVAFTVAGHSPEDTDPKTPRRQGNAPAEP